jgi:hypothetical protein
MSGARISNVDPEKLDIMNERVVLSSVEAKKKAHPEALWIANTHKEVDLVNREDFNEKVQAEVTHVRIIVQYTTATSSKPNPNQEEKKKLYLRHDKKKPQYIDLAIGTRVLCPNNLGTQIGTQL